MKRLSLWLLLLTTLFATGSVVFILNSETALRWAFSAAGHWLPGTLSARSVQGKLAGPIRLEGLRYETPTLRVTSDRLRLDWRPLDLLDGRLHLQRITVADLRIETTPAAPTTPAGNADLTKLSVPLPIQLDALDISSLRLRDAQGKEQHIQRLHLAARLDQDQLHLDALSLAAPQGSLTAKGSIAAEDLRTHLEIRWHLTLADTAPLEGHGIISGNRHTLQITQTLTAPQTARLKATVRNPLDKLSWQATLALQDFNPRQLRGDWPALVFNANARGQGDLSRLQATLHGDTILTDVGRVEADVQLRGGTAPEWRIDQFHLRLPAQNASLEGRGQFSLADTGVDYRFTGQWQDLAWPLQTTPRVQSRQGHFEIAGSNGEYRANLSGELQGLQLPPATLALQGRGNLQGFTFQSLDLETLGGHARGQGELAWQPELRWQASLQLQDMDPGQYWPQWPGRLHARLTSQGRLVAGQPRLQLHLQQLGGTLHGLPVAGSGKLDLDRDRYQLSQLEARVGDAELHAQGELQQQWQFAWSLKAADLATLWPGLAGQITATGQLSGARRQPRVVAQVAAQKLHWAGVHMGNVQGHMDVDLGNQAPSHLELQVHDGRYEHWQFQQAELAVNGKPARHEGQLTVRQDGTVLGLKVEGGYANRAWQGRLDRAQFDTAQAGSWSLQAPATLDIAGDQLTLGKACWRATQGRFCVNGSWRPAGNSELQGDFAAIPSKLLAPLLPDAWQWRDSLNGRLQASVTPQRQVQLAGKLQLGPGHIAYVDTDGEPIRLDYAKGELNLGADDTGSHAELDLRLNDQDRIQARVSLPGYASLALPPPDQPLAGQLRGRYSDLDLLAVFVPALQAPRGKLTWDLGLGGSVAQPRLSGTGSLAQGAVGLPELGIELSKLQLAFNSEDSNRLHFQGETHSGRGVLSINGDWDLDAEAGWPLHAKLQGKEVEILRRPGLWLVASPDLDVTIRHRLVTLRGSIVLPEARIETKQLPQPAITPSEDVVFVGPVSPPAAPASAWNVDMEVRLIPGERVNFEGFGLSGQVTGELLVRRAADQGYLGTGSLQIVNGQYRAFGIDLDIQQGQLVFANSPLDNPGIDLRAVRVIDEAGTKITAGMHVQGRLREATLTLFSEPPMAESDILSYILLGRPAGEAADSDANLLMAATTALGTTQAYLAAKRLAQSLGFEEATVNRRGLVLGKAVSPRLYVSYEIGLLAPSNTLQIRYKLSQRWTVKAESGEGESADLVFTIER
jgi:translocation and assembly module TamB